MRVRKNKTEDNIMKKFWIYFLIVIAVILFACVSLAVVLVLMPGKEIFGIKYISAVVGDYKETVSQQFSTQDIYIYTYDVPIYFTFAEPGNVGVELVQQYQGYTRAKDTPSIKFKNKDGDDYNPDQDSSAVYIYINQYKKFIWNNGQMDCYVNINLPSSYKNNGNIYIESDYSNVTISGASKIVQSLTIKTEGKVEIKNNLSVQNLKVQTKSDLKLGENVKIKPSYAGATSQLDVTIPNASLTISNAVENGDIIFNTASGNLNFNTCRNLSVYSSSGNINQPYAKNISGNLVFETTSGSVDIDSVKGANNSIKSVSGSISLGFCGGDLSIITNRSNIKLGTVKNANITTTTGDVAITYVTGDISVSSSRSGDILCGTVMGNAQFETYKGDISASGAVAGNLSMKAKTGEFRFVSCKDLVAQSESGSLLGYNEANTVVNGVADISIKKGDVKINKILGTSVQDFDNTIFCDDGVLEINTITGTTKISSGNSTISLSSVGFVNIDTSYSKVTINDAPNGATVSNLGGDIIVGDSNNSSQTIGKLVLKSGTGNIFAYNTTEDVYLYSDEAVVFQNKSSNVIYINTTPAGDTTGSKTATGAVMASNLQGTVRIASGKNVSLKFSKISGDVRVNTNGACETVIIDAKCAGKNTINYLVQSSKGKLNSLIVGNSIEQASRLYQSKDDSYNTITVYTTQAGTTLYLGE